MLDPSDALMHKLVQGCNKFRVVGSVDDCWFILDLMNSQILEDVEAAQASGGKSLGPVNSTLILGGYMS